MSARSPSTTSTRTPSSVAMRRAHPTLAPASPLRGSGRAARSTGHRGATSVAGAARAANTSSAAAPPWPRVGEAARMADESRPVSEADVERVIAEITARDIERGRDAQHVYDTLTWGEGP